MPYPEVNGPTGGVLGSLLGAAVAGDSSKDAVPGAIFDQISGAGPGGIAQDAFKAILGEEMKRRYGQARDAWGQLWLGDRSS
jgi:hypothetical protein